MGVYFLKMVAYLIDKSNETSMNQGSHCSRNSAVKERLSSGSRKKRLSFLMQESLGRVLFAHGVDSDAGETEP